MKIEGYGMALIGGILIGLLVGFSLGVAFLPQGPTNEADLNYFEGHFDRLEQGITNSNQDICFSNNGQWLVDANGNLIKIPFNENYDNFPCLIAK